MEIAQMNAPLCQTDDKVTLGEKMSAIEFDHVFELYYKRVYKYICYRINNQHMAEDLCSQAFERVITRFDTYSPKKSSFEIWLFAIVRNIIADYHRSNKKRFALSLDSILDLISPKPSLEEEVIAEDGNRELFLALSQLTDKERNIISMKFAAGLKNSEIADLLGISGSNVGVVLYRSLKKLHNLLDMGGYEHE